MRFSDDIFKYRDNLVSVTELGNFSDCQAYSFFENILGRRPFKNQAELLSIEEDTDYHRLYSEAVEVERLFVLEHLDELIGGKIDDIPKELFKSYVFGSLMKPGAGAYEESVKGKGAEADAWLRFEHFAERKAGIEAERIRKMIEESSDPEKALREFYAEARLVDFEREMPVAGQLFGAPDLYRKVDGRWVVEEFKVSERLDEVSLQLDAYVSLTDGDIDLDGSGSAILLTLDEGVTNYSPSQRSLDNVAETLELLLELKGEMAERRCAVPMYPFESCDAGGEECRFSARCDPQRVDAVENLGELRMVADYKGRQRWPSRRKTVGIEALVSAKAIKHGNSAYETTRMFGGFKSLREFCHDNGIYDLDDQLRFVEINANSSTVDRLVLAMEFGFKDTQRMSIGGVAKMLNISDTSAKLLADIAYKLGWLHEPQEIPHPFADGGSITYYRRRKRSEMEDNAWEIFDGTRKDVMVIMRKCRVPLTTFCKPVFKEIEKVAGIDEQWQYIWDSDFDADKTGGCRRFRSFRRVEDKDDVLAHSGSLVDAIYEMYRRESIGDFFQNNLAG